MGHVHKGMFLYLSWGRRGSLTIYTFTHVFMPSVYLHNVLYMFLCMHAYVYVCIYVCMQ